MSSKPATKDVPENTAIEPPVVSTPQGGKTYSNPVKFSGTGLPGWRVYFFTVPTNGDDFGSAEVREHGGWEFDAYLGPGTFKVFGWQTDNRLRSPWTPFIEFTVTS
ncbi:hypothetical protein [Pseudomonas sp. NS1(2017)]|jgi:hypothetical protein|uniref:hypothetical protein n=1 Tax=Pseudomonas sp. NS1(2017) TaxID=2025658 RepID=UPI0012FDE4B4|nr:hypothetical protein [Pseudomonas sp. NS1(2017)]